MGRTNTDIFLEKYKELESAVPGSGIKGSPQSVYDLEEMLTDEAVKNKIKICRLMRNYIQHNDPGFVEITDKQIEFLDDVMEMVTGKKRLIKNNMKRIQKPLTIKSTIQEGFIALSNRGTDWLPVCDSKGELEGIVTYPGLAAALASGMTVKSRIQEAIQKKGYQTVSPEDEYKKLKDGIKYIVINKENKVIGTTI